MNKKKQFVLSKNKGFTLAELTLALLVMSIIIIALAPVITKRVINNIQVTSGTQSEVKAYTYDQCENIPECTKVENPDGTKYCNCEFSAPANAKALNVVMVSGGGGGAGALDSGVTSSSASTSDTQKEVEIEITRGLQNVVITDLTGGGGGGGGAWAKDFIKSPSGLSINSQSDCDKFNAKFLTEEQNGGITACVMKYNIGDIPGITRGGIPSWVSIITTIYDTNEEACWQGTSTNPCDSNTMSYSGCTRTVCTWFAANSSCSSLAYNGTKAGDWRLPTRTELESWGKNISDINTNQGDSGLRLCDHASNTGVALCNSAFTCSGTHNGKCPSYYWSLTNSSEDHYYYYILSEGVFYEMGAYSAWAALSARCVLPGESKSTTVYSGGGGGSAPYVSNLSVNNTILNENVGGTIKLIAGPGGTGGNSGNSSGNSGSNGNDGSSSKIEIYSKENVLVWAYEVSGGKGGKAATSSAQGGQSGTSNTCREYNNGTWTSQSCSGNGNNGLEGNKNNLSSNLSTADGGGGANSGINNGGGGAGGTLGSANGSAGASAGAGGGGATVTFDSSKNATRGTGGKGGNGKVSIQYDFYPQSAAGGGGGGGAFAKVRDILVTTGSKYAIKVGAGGIGGAVNYNGKDGGDSSAEFGSLKITTTGGKGGKIGSKTSTDVIQGLGGIGGTITTNGVKGDSEYRVGKAGGEGKNATNGSGESWGGLGGESGIRTIGACGGLSLILPCANSSNINGLSINFEGPKDITGTAEYGSAGAGGGGGGWSANISSYPSPGIGGNGQNGYVYIYWTRN